MNIYHAHGREKNHDSFSFVVQAETEETARRLVREVLKENPVQFCCKNVGMAFEGEWNETIIW